MTWDDVFQLMLESYKATSSNRRQDREFKLKEETASWNKAKDLHEIRGEAQTRLKTIKEDLKGLSTEEMRGIIEEDAPYYEAMGLKDVADDIKNTIYPAYRSKQLKEAQAKERRKASAKGVPQSMVANIYSPNNPYLLPDKMLTPIGQGINRGWEALRRVGPAMQGMSQQYMNPSQRQWYMLPDKMLNRGR